jgi:hypothetical protein
MNLTIKKTKIMKTKGIILLSIFAIFLSFTGCEEEETSTDKGTLSLALTDAPIDDESVTGVWIKINGLQYHKQNNSWATYKGYDGPKTVNLLELRDTITMLGDFEMEAGQYNQLRFILDAPIRGESAPSNPGCYITFNDDSKAPLFVPSGSQSGFKATGAFQVPSNGTVNLTADFDVRKSVVEINSGSKYILKPTIRLIADNEAGKIVGNLKNVTDTSSEYVVYAYENDTYTSSEKDAEVEENAFPNAVTSDIVGEEYGYQLRWLAPMTYDLVVARYVDTGFKEVIGVSQDVAVESKKTTNKVIDLSSL